MICLIPDILTSEELTQVSLALQSAEFVDGAETAGWHAKGVKHNRQLIAGMPGHDGLEAIIRPALLRNPLFQMAVRPRYMLPLLFNRYESGQGYGPHVDDSLMSAPGKATAAIRTDVSFTLFVTQPQDYQGGELVVSGDGPEQSFKLAAGAALIYPSGSLHRVATLTSGVRLAAAGWCQSEIRQAEQRALLFDLDRARRALFAESGKSETFDLLSRTFTNLLRMWAQA